MSLEFKRIEKITNYIRTITDFKPKIALILGSGLGALANEIEIVAKIPYSSLPDFPVSTVPGHAGQFVLGGSINGWVEWKNKDGKTLDELYRK